MLTPRLLVTEPRSLSKRPAMRITKSDSPRGLVAAEGWAFVNDRNDGALGREAWPKCRFII